MRSKGTRGARRRGQARPSNADPKMPREPKPNELTNTLEPGETPIKAVAAMAVEGVAVNAALLTDLSNRRLGAVDLTEVGGSALGREA